MLKKLIILVHVTSLFAVNAQWQDFENNLYAGGAYSINNSSVAQFGSSSGNSGLINIGTTALLDNHVYFNLNGEANFNANADFISNWYNTTLKLGYSLQPDEILNFIPYALIGYGNQGAYFSSVPSFNYGIGLISELMITTNWLLYTDINYQWQNFTKSINDDFNNNVVDNFANYILTGTPTSYGIDFGAKYITNNGFYVNPFIKYQYYQQVFSQTGGNIDYGTLTPTVNQYQFGINFGLII